MKARERLVERNALFGRLVAGDNREEPRPEVLEDLLRKLPASGSTARAAVRTPARRLQQWVPLATLAGCLAASALVAEQSVRRSSEGMATAAPTMAPSPTVAPSRSERAEPAEPQEASAVPTAHIDDLPSAAATSMSASSKRELPGTDGRREIELIITAREALTKLEVDRCLAAVAEYESAFPRGQFVLEAKIMRIEAVAARGDSERARALARDFLAKNPSSLYDDRVRSLLASLEER